VTPGWFDLRPVVERLPWPAVAGARCLDVGTYDGFYAFELERRGAREVLATDIADHDEWDLPVSERETTAAAIADFSGQKGLGFELARRLTGSMVQKQTISVYDLRPDAIGQFDVVVCGSLLLHLRDPVGALEAIRSVCRGWFISVEQISLGLSMRFRRRPVAQIEMTATPTQWWVPNAAGHRRMVEVAGFEVTEVVKPFCVPFGSGHPPRGKGLHGLSTRISRRLLAGGDGVPHSALLARVRP
jgi:tRNA (mo5U34)-methyltransferase